MKQQLPFRMPQNIYISRDKVTGATTTVAVDKRLTLNDGKHIIRKGFIVYATGFQSKHETRSRAMCQLNGRIARFSKQAPGRVSMFI